MLAQSSWCRPSLARFSRQILIARFSKHRPPACPVFNTTAVMNWTHLQKQLKVQRTSCKTAQQAVKVKSGRSRTYHVPSKSMVHRSRLTTLPVLRTPGKIGFDWLLVFSALTNTDDPQKETPRKMKFLKEENVRSTTVNSQQV